MLQYMLLTHGVALEVAAFFGHHITTQGKEAGLEVVFPESDRSAVLIFLVLLQNKKTVLLLASNSGTVLTTKTHWGFKAHS